MCYNLRLRHNVTGNLNVAILIKSPILATSEKFKTLNKNGTVRRKATKSGIVTKGLKGAWDGITDGVRKLTAGKSVFDSENKTVNSSTDSSQHKQDSEPNHSVNEKSENHNQPPNESLNTNNYNENQLNQNKINRYFLVSKVKERGFLRIYLNFKFYSIPLSLFKGMELFISIK